MIRITVKELDEVAEICSEHGIPLTYKEIQMVLEATNIVTQRQHRDIRAVVHPK